MCSFWSIMNTDVNVLSWTGGRLQSQRSSPFMSLVQQKQAKSEGALKEVEVEADHSKAECSLDRCGGVNRVGFFRINYKWRSVRLLLTISTSELLCAP
jgi:hypothetical protein